MFKSRETRRLVLAGTATAVAFGSLAASAAAATNTTTHTAKWPLFGNQGASLEVSADFPSSVQVGEPIPSTAVTSKATFNSILSQGIDLVDGGHTLEGELRLKGSITTPTGGVVTVQLPGEITPINVDADAPAPDPLVLEATANTPQVTIDDPGTANINVVSFSANLTLRDVNGDVIQIPNPSGIPDSDGNPDTFDVVSTLAPATGQNTLLTSINIGDPGPVVGAPVIDRITGGKPRAAIGGAVVVHGSKLATTTSVTVGGKPATFVVVNAKKLLVLAPSQPAAGDYPVVVTNDKGASEAATLNYR